MRAPARVSFAKCRAASREISDEAECLEGLREKLRTDADPLSIARSAALAYVDIIERLLRLQTHVDVIAFEALEQECPLMERTRRMSWVIQSTTRISKLVCQALDGYITCIGGKDAIAIQAMAQWIGRRTGGAPSEVAQRELDVFARIMAQQSTKKKRSRKR